MFPCPPIIFLVFYCHCWYCKKPSQHFAPTSPIFCLCWYYKTLSPFRTQQLRLRVPMRDLRPAYYLLKLPTTSPKIKRCYNSIKSLNGIMVHRLVGDHSSAYYYLLGCHAIQHRILIGYSEFKSTNTPSTLIYNAYLCKKKILFNHSQ